ncbi:MAG: hypothetical protein E6H10_10185 [Bacteroidetes bacterium]|nr:MAG: hypothetical protein E6H10_10185 [Bacteroidota bacterium]
MKKYLIGSIVGGIIIFLWQGLSWMALGIHSDSMMYNASQENIMSLPVIGNWQTHSYNEKATQSLSRFFYSN